MDFIINRKVTIAMLFTALTMLGYFSYERLPVELIPNAELPTFYIQVNSMTEVGPEYMEKQAIIPLEGAAGTLEGVEDMESFSSANQGTITLQYDKNANIKFAYLELLEKVESVKNTLPEGFFVNVVKVDTEMINNMLMVLQVRGSGGADRVRDITEKEVMPALENINGIAGAQLYGGREKSVEIKLNNRLCEAYGITPALVRAKITEFNEYKTFAGDVIEGGIRHFVNVTAEYQDIKDIQSVIILNDGPIRLGDIAEINFGTRESTTISRVNGKEAVSIQLLRDSQVNMIDLSHQVQDVIEKLNEQLVSQDIELAVQFDAAEMMEENIDQIVELALVGGLLAVLVLWLFLKNFRLVVVIALSIPISVFTAFNFFFAWDISLNSLTLVGMALAVGMLVDNSVVVMENIYRHASLGASPGEAVVKGVGEIKRSVFAATLTTIMVFLPFVFSSEMFVRLFGTHIGVSVVSTLVVSLFVALLFVSMVMYAFMGTKQDKTFNKVSLDLPAIRAYIVLLKAAMRHPARTVITGVFAFFLIVLISLAVSIASSQEVESEELNIQVTMSGGSTLETADEIVKEIESKLEGIEETEDLVANIDEEKASLQLKLKEDYEETYGRGLAAIKSDIIERTKGLNTADIEVSGAADMGSGGGSGGGGSGRKRGGAGFRQFLGLGGNEETLVVVGQDFEEMRRVAEDLKYYLGNLDPVREAGMSIADNRPEIHILWDQRLMDLYGLTLQEVTTELASFQPEFETGILFKQGVEEYEITIRSNEDEEDEARSMDDLKKVEVTGRTGAAHELQSIGDLYYGKGMWGTSRVNQQKEIRVNYSFYEDYNESADLQEAAQMQVAAMLARQNLPSGIAIIQEEEDNSLEEYKFLMLAAAVLIFMVLASIFESLVTPFVLMFSIPLAAIGSLLLLSLTGNSLLNPNSLTGLLILIGVVVNNSIILVDYSNVLRKRGYGRLRALITAGVARVRPILITAITTIIAMLPLAMGQMEYVAVIGAPFAITVIGGLAFSTILTLVFIPTLNIGLENALEWMRGLDWKIQVLQLLAALGFGWLVYEGIDSNIWRSLWFFIILVGVPGTTWFLMKSLQQASEEIIPRTEDLEITIENLVKVYGRDNRFVREWKSRVTGNNSAPKVADISDLLWQAPLLAFGAYFTYFYLSLAFWAIVFSLVTFLLLLALLDSGGRLMERFGLPGKLKKAARFLYLMAYWVVPAGNAAWLYFKWESLTLSIFVFIVWYLALVLNRAANRLKGDLNPEALKGRLRRMFYRMVYKVPLIGKKKEPFKALKGVSLTIEKGMFGLLGPNGAGKTTIMRTICGIFEQSYGKIWINGIDTTEKREELQGLIGYLPQEFGMYENLTPHEYLHYQAILKGIGDKKVRDDRVRTVLESVNMYDQRDKKIGSFSGGMKQRIGIAQILLHLPRILVVDEPTAGLDPRERIRFRNLLVQLSRERIVIFSTHIIEDIASSCRKVAVLGKGSLKYLGSPSEMVALAEGKTWQFNVSPDDFAEVSKKHRIVHHMYDGDFIRVRCLSSERPSEDATSVPPSLEDSYLWLMGDTIKKVNGTNNDQ